MAEIEKEWALILYWEPLGIFIYDRDDALPAPDIAETLQLSVVGIIPTGEESFYLHVMPMNREGKNFALNPWNGYQPFEAYAP